MRCIRHFFDKTTHRCTSCGRAQPGTAPKKTPTKPRDECQVCAGTYALDATGKLGHHGYERPGCGWIVGDCAGVREKPFPATDALERWLARVESQRKDTRASLKALPERTEITERFMEYNTETRKRDKVVVKVAKKPAGPVKTLEQVRYLGGPWCEWWTAFNRRERDLTQTIEMMTKEIERVTARIEKGKALRATAGVA